MANQAGSSNHILGHPCYPVSAYHRQKQGQKLTIADEEDDILRLALRNGLGDVPMSDGFASAIVHQFSGVLTGLDEKVKKRPFDRVKCQIPASK